MAGEACHSCTNGPLRFRLSGSSTLVEGGTSGSVLLRSTSIIGGYQVASSVLAAFQSSGSLKLKRSGLRLPFSPSGHTTPPPHCSILHTCNWCRQPQALLLGKPLVMMPMCPSLDKGAWTMASFILAWACGQLVPLSASNISF